MSWRLWFIFFWFIFQSGQSDQQHSKRASFQRVSGNWSLLFFLSRLSAHCGKTANWHDRCPLLPFRNRRVMLYFHRIRVLVLEQNCISANFMFCEIIDEAHRPKKFCEGCILYLTRVCGHIHCIRYIVMHNVFFWTCGSRLPFVPFDMSGCCWLHFTNLKTESYHGLLSKSTKYFVTSNL